jgi:hypothetical protein
MDETTWEECLRIVAEARKAKREYSAPVRQGVSFRHELPVEKREPANINNFKYELQEDFLMQDCSMVVAIPANMEMMGPLSGEMRRRYKPEEILFNQRKLTGSVAVLYPESTGVKGKHILFLLTKNRNCEKTKSIDLARCILDLRRVIRSLQIERIAIPSIDHNLDGIPFHFVKRLYEAVFQPTETEMTVCTYYYTNLLKSIRETTPNEEAHGPGTSAL